MRSAVHKNYGIRRWSLASKLSASASAVDALAADTDGAEGPNLDFGLACAQGPRSTMEDELCVIPGFGDQLYAGMNLC